MTALDEGAPEFASAEALVQHLLDEERTSYTLAEAEALGRSLQQSLPTVHAALQSYGLAHETRLIPRRVRGFTTSSNDRFYGPGSSAMHGGSGWEIISGFVGNAAR